MIEQELFYQIVAFLLSPAQVAGEAVGAGQEIDVVDGKRLLKTGGYKEEKMVKLMVVIGLTVLALVFPSAVVNAQWGDEVSDSSGEQIGIGFEAFTPVNPGGDTSGSQVLASPESRAAEGFASEGSINEISWNDMPALVEEQPDGGGTVQFIDGAKANFYSGNDVITANWDGGSFSGQPAQFSVEGLTFYGEQQTVEDTASIKIDNILWERGNQRGDYGAQDYTLTLPGGTTIGYTAQPGVTDKVVSDSDNGISFTRTLSDNREAFIRANGGIDAVANGDINIVQVGENIVKVSGFKDGRVDVGVQDSQTSQPSSVVKMEDWMATEKGSSLSRTVTIDSEGVSITKRDGVIPGSRYTLDSQNGGVLVQWGYDDQGRAFIDSYQLESNAEIKEALKAGNRQNLQYNSDGSLDIYYKGDGKVEQSVHISAKVPDSSVGKLIGREYSDSFRKFF